MASKPKEGEGQNKKIGDAQKKWQKGPKKNSKKPLAAATATQQKRRGTPAEIKQKVLMLILL